MDEAFLDTATYRSLGEQHLSPAEERFEKGRRTVGLLLAPLAALLFTCVGVPAYRSKRGGRPGAPAAVA